MASAELYDRATGQWSVTGSLAVARNFHSAQTEGFLRRFIDSVVERHEAGSQQSAPEGVAE